MPSVLNEVRSQALGLPPSERELLIHDLLVSLDDSSEGEAGVDAAWAVEIARRSAEVHFGTAKLIDMDDALGRVLSAAQKSEQ
jgi:hypothetical protein